MPNYLGRSVYLTSFEQQRASLDRDGQNAPVFLSLHISEEFSSDYCERAERLCHWLSQRNYRVIADVSTKTIDQFSQPDLIRLAETLGLWGLRIDFGFSEEEITTLARRFPIVLNASTTDPAAARRIAKDAVKVMAMHNFYPRPETGLDDDYFRQSTQALRDAGLSVLAFIPGDELLRGPLREGLPTLERHRGLPPSVCFADLALNFGVEEIFVGDPKLSQRELARIERFLNDGVWELPAELSEEYRSLYGQVFTNRIDSPATLIRFKESRTYSCFGRTVEPALCVPRVRGSVTVDNAKYGRYSGEIQLTRKDYPADERVNVIGQVKEKYLPLADCIHRGTKFCLSEH